MESTSEKAVESDPLPCSLEENKDEIDIINILCTLTIKCREEMENNCLYKPLEDYIERVANNKRASKDVINNTISRGLKEINLKHKYFEQNDRINIFKYISDLYTNKEIVTYKNVFAWYKTINPAITYFQFQYMMSCLGFQYHKTELGKQNLIEDPSLFFERHLFLKEIYNLRLKCAPIFYIDERFFDSTHTFLKPWINDIDISSPTCDGYVFFHAISTEGFLNGLFCSPTTKTDFVKWITNIILPLLSGPSVFVMDNNDIHGSVLNNITKYHSRADMLQYLKERNIPCNEYLHKAELFELIKKCSVKHVSYDVDEILRAHGHRVLRLPANFHDLTLTHFLWKYILGLKEDFLLNVEWSKVKLVILDKLKSLPKTLWGKFYEQLLATEHNILLADSRTYKALES